MKKYLVITMDKSTHEIHKEYVEDVDLHGTRIEEYIDNIISKVGSIFWGVFNPNVDEELAEREFLNHISRNNKE